MKEERKDVRSFVEGLRFVDPLEPRDVFYGGRTNAIKLYHLADGEKGEKIHYYDFTSLYPYVNKRGRYPVGHPDIISQPGHTDLSKYFGLAKATVLPPRGLYHPVLQVREGGKLTFPLCRTCVMQEMSKPLMKRSEECQHSDEERMMTGTWCTPELEKAVEKGYRILYVYEVWHFHRSMVGLFQKYVDTWLQIKEQGSGWPASVSTEEERERYVEEYRRHEGIKLDHENIDKN